MKKAFLFKITLLFGTMFSGILLLLLLFVVCMDGGAESSLYIPADDETAAAYQAICSETGVPWDIALMAACGAAGPADRGERTADHVAAVLHPHSDRTGGL